MIDLEAILKRNEAEIEDARQFLEASGFDPKRHARQDDEEWALEGGDDGYFTDPLTGDTIIMIRGY